MYASCSDEYGSLGWAIDRCKKITGCNILNDVECDNANWRYCVGLDIADFADTSEESCSLIRAPKGEAILVQYLKIKFIHFEISTNQHFI